MSSTPPTGLLPSEVSGLRAAAGISVEDFANAFGVGPNVVERWEAYGVPKGPTALALRLVADSMDFEFPVPTLGGDPCQICGSPASDTFASLSVCDPCQICGSPASDTFASLSVCPSCHREPVKSMEALGYGAMTSHNVVSMQTSFELRLPADRKMKFTGRFLSEGLGTLLTKLFKEEPQIGDQTWDDAVYVQWVEPGLDALADGETREVIRSLVAFGMLDVAHDSVRVSHAPSFGSFDEEILLLCGLLASRQS